MSLLAYSNIFLDPVGNTVSYDDTGATFAASPPISNLSKMQLNMFAYFTGETAAFDADAGAEHSVTVLALLGHTLASGMEVEFLNGAVSLGTVTVANYQGLPQNAILVLSAPVTLQALSVSITGGTAGVDYRLGALWASGGFNRCITPDGFGYGVASLSRHAWAGGVGYSSRRASQDVPRFSFTPLNDAGAIGPAYPNVRAIWREIGTHAPVLLIPFEDELAHSVYGLPGELTGPSRTANKRWRAGLTIRQQGT